MIYRFVFFSLLSAQVLAGWVGNFKVLPQPVPSASISQSFVTTCFNSVLNKTVFAWADYATGYPYYDIYDPTTGSFSGPTVISTSNPLYLVYNLNFVSNSYNSRENSVLFAWNSNNPDINNNKNLYYAVLQFPSNTITNYSYETQDPYSYVWQTPLVCYNKKDDITFFSWSPNEDAIMTPQYPFTYAVYKTGMGFGSSQASVSSSDMQSLAFTSYNSQMNQAILSWVQYPTNFPEFAIYDFESNSITTLATPISTSIQAGSNVISSYNSLSNEVIFSFPDENGYMYYAVYDCASQIFTTSPTLISNDLICLDQILSCYSSVTNQVIFSWVDGNTLNPYLAIYDCTAKSFTTTPMPISEKLYVQYDVYCSYNEILNEVTFSWLDVDTKIPYYAVYSILPSSFGLQKALKYSGVKILKSGV